MKRLLTLAAALMALMMVLSLSACGETAEETGEESTVETTAPAAPVDLAALREQLLTDCGISDFVNVETDALTNLYGIDAAGVASSASFSASSGAAFPQEIVMVQAVDEAAAGTMLNTLKGLVSQWIEADRDYAPEEVPKLEKAVLRQSGAWVVLVVANDPDAAAKLVGEYI